MKVLYGKIQRAFFALGRTACPVGRNLLCRFILANRSRPYISVLTIDDQDEKYQTILIRRQDAYLEEGLQEIYGEYRYQERIRLFALYGKRPQMCSRCIASPSILHRRTTSPTFLDL